MPAVFKIEVFVSLSSTILEQVDIALRIRDTDAFGIELLFDCLSEVRFDGPVI